MQFLVLKKRAIVLIFLIGLSIVTASIWFLINSKELPVFKSQSVEKIREIHLVTGEFKSKTDNGKIIEAYRWDPGTIFMETNEKVNLVIYGVNGNEHPFMIEGTTIKGTVKKGQETIVPLQFKQEGTYRLICLTHPDKQKNGPMIAYIVVD